MYLQLSGVSLRDSNPSRADIQGNVPNMNEFVTVLQVNIVFPCITELYSTVRLE